MENLLINTSISNFLSSNGVTHKKSCPCTPEQNGVAERKHKRIVETTLSLLCTAFMPLEFWVYAFQTAVFLINCMPISPLDGQSPFECLFGYYPNLHRLKVFGCVCFPLLCPYNSHKFEPRITQHVFLGYALEYKGCLCFNPLTQHNVVARHVLFHEHIFPFATLRTSSLLHPTFLILPLILSLLF